MVRSEGNILLRAVALPTAITLLVLAVIVGAILHVSTSKTDALALQRQTQRVEVAVGQGMRSVTVDQEASTYWDDAVIRTRQRPLDLDWIDNNLGVWFHTYYQFDETYLLDQHDAPIYAMRDGRRVSPASFTRVAAPALDLAAQLRKKLAVSRLAPDGSLDGKTVGATEVAIVGGRPAFVSVKPIVAETDRVSQAPRSEYLHVAVRYLDGSFLKRMSKLYVVEEPRFSWTPSGPAYVAIHDPRGRSLGYVGWKPFEPGEQVEDQMVPVLISALLIIGLLISLLLWRIHRSRSDLEESRAEAQRLAFHDRLTGLPNRALFEDRLELALSRRNANVAVLMLDLDRFKNVNDTLGHQAGDALIRQFGERLTSLTRECDTISRLGGDEFAVLIEGARLPDVDSLAKRIIDDMARPFELSRAQVHVGVSIGIALSSAGDNGAELVRQADIALYQAKDGGRNDCRLFRPEMDQRVKLRAAIEQDLREALASEQGLSIHYQPQVDREGSIIGVEALLRWEHPTRGLIAPKLFVPIAEESGLIVPLGEWVLAQACRVSRQWPELFVAVNLSPVQFRSPDFLQRVTSIVGDAGASPNAIQLEVTERVLLDDEEAVESIIESLRADGFKIVLDDFGTGYSSLSYLRKFEVDKIKIDGSFVQHLEENSDSRAIVTAVLALGQAMGLTVAAEGVETEEQKTFLAIAGCTEMQGHLFSRAVPEEELGQLLGSGRSSSAVA